MKPNRLTANIETALIAAVITRIGNLPPNAPNRNGATRRETVAAVYARALVENRLCLCNREAAAVAREITNAALDLVGA